MLAPGAGAFKLAQLNMRVLHGDFAFGYAGGSDGSAILNIKTGKLRALPTPPDATHFVPIEASDVAMVGVTDNSAKYMNPAYLYRYNNRTGSRELLDTVSRGEDTCRDDIRPISISDDGTVVAEIVTFVPGPVGCRINAGRSLLRKYPPGAQAAQSVWLPAKYQPWLSEGLLDANEDTLVIATRGASGGPGEIAVLDIERQTVIAERLAANVGKLSLANPHSLYFSQTLNPQLARGTDAGTMKYWRIGARAPRTLYRGQIAPYLSTNCGNRALVASNRRLQIIDRKGRVSFKRRVGTKHAISLTVCSADNLHFLDVDLQGAGTGENPFVKHLINISRLP